MFIAETAFALSAISTLPGTNLASHNYLITEGAQSCYQLASGTLMETRVIEHFDKLAGVSGVRVGRNDDSFSIDVDVFTFDKPTRRRIYAKERDLNELFQNFSFDVRLIDLSGTATNNAQHE